MTITVKCQTRQEDSKPRALRRQGLIPATLYGHDGAASISLTLDGKEAQNLLKKASVNNTLIDLNIPEIDWNGKTLIREVQAHPWKRTLYHLSFFSVAAQKKIKVAVQLKMVGQALGVKKGGLIEQTISEIEVECSPDNIPESIEIDMSQLDIGTRLHVGELELPPGVSALGDPSTTIFSIIAPAKMVPTETEAKE
ncbi:MAG: 50S ribosomal protein L25/general stress protein Ctc [Prochloron sp. SP5CPC1]|nr:50S ribosomal protein L25/general stress protein Ctc [Candidatus Paraprochloron terpiosi SP5CPC1]